MEGCCASRIIELRVEALPPSRTLFCASFETRTTLGPTLSPLVGTPFVRDLGKSRETKIDWAGLFNKGRQVNLLSGARFFLFASRDVWFEVALPLFLKGGLGWNSAFVGLFIAGERRRDAESARQSRAGKAPCRR